MTLKHQLKYAVFACLLQAGSALCASPATAQDYVEAFKAYSAALDQGDTDSALTHAESAWQMAEAELGKHELTGILAFNYGSLLITRDPAEARRPLRRARAISNDGLVELPTDQLNAYMAYTDYTRQQTKENTSTLLAAMDTLSGGNQSPAMDDMFILLNVAVTEANGQRLWNAEPFSDRVVSAIEAAGAEESHRGSLNPALIIRAAAGVSGRNRTHERLDWAHDDISRVLETFQPQAAPESIDPIFAQALAWHAVIHHSLTRPIEFHDHGDGRQEPIIFASELDGPEDCGGIWGRTLEPNFATSGVFPGYVGAALIVYDVSDDGSVENARILTQVPNTTLGPASLRAMKRWRYDVVPADHPACRTNQVQAFVYSSEWP